MSDPEATEATVHRSLTLDYTLPDGADWNAFEDKVMDWFVDEVEMAGGQCDGAGSGPWEDEAQPGSDWLVNLRCRCGNEIEIHHKDAVAAKTLAESIMAVHERWCQEVTGDEVDRGAGSSIGESALATEVAGSSPAQPQPADKQMCLCTHSRLEHRLAEGEPCRVSGCYCPAFRLAPSTGEDQSEPDPVCPNGCTPVHGDGSDEEARSDGE